MKYTGGKSWFNKSTQEWEYIPRVYTNYYCSLKEWALNHHKEYWTENDERITIEIVDGSEIPYKLINNN